MARLAPASTSKPNTRLTQNKRGPTCPLGYKRQTKQPFERASRNRHIGNSRQLPAAPGVSWPLLVAPSGFRRLSGLFWVAPISYRRFQADPCVAQTAPGASKWLPPGVSRCFAAATSVSRRLLTISGCSEQLPAAPRDSWRLPWIWQGPAPGVIEMRLAPGRFCRKI